jgi:hypothetical protein
MFTEKLSQCVAEKWTTLKHLTNVKIPPFQASNQQFCHACITIIAIEKDSIVAWLLQQYATGHSR